MRELTMRRARAGSICAWANLPLHKQGRWRDLPQDAKDRPEVDHVFIGKSEGCISRFSAM
jgi:hypothetical protein